MMRLGSSRFSEDFYRLDSQLEARFCDFFDKFRPLLLLEKLVLELVCESRWRISFLLLILCLTRSLDRLSRLPSSKSFATDAYLSGSLVLKRLKWQGSWLLDFTRCGAKIFIYRKNFCLVLSTAIGSILSSFSVWDILGNKALWDRAFTLV